MDLERTEAILSGLEEQGNRVRSIAALGEEVGGLVVAMRDTDSRLSQSASALADGSTGLATVVASFSESADTRIGEMGEKLTEGLQSLQSELDRVQTLLRQQATDLEAMVRSQLDRSVTQFEALVREESRSLGQQVATGHQWLRQEMDTRVSEAEKSASERLSELSRNLRIAVIVASVAAVGSIASVVMLLTGQ